MNPETKKQDNDCPSADSLYKYVRGMLVSKIEHIIWEHVCGCPDCREKVSKIRKGGGWL